LTDRRPSSGQGPGDRDTAPKRVTSVETVDDLERILGRDLIRYHPDAATGNNAVDLGVLCSNLTAFIKRGEPSAAAIACALIGADPQMPFGKIIKSNLARALRQQAGLLVQADRDIIVRKTVELLGLASSPRELEDYCKLVRRLGPAASREVAENATPRCPRSERLTANLVELTGPGG